MHNGAFTSLEDAIRYHLDAVAGAAGYTPARLPADLQGSMGPIQPVLDRLDPLLTEPVQLTGSEFNALVAFVLYGTAGRLLAGYSRASGITTYW